MILPAQAEPRTLTEYEIKAAFVYHFAKFVEWPEEIMRDGRPFVIGIVGQDPFGNFIDEAISGKNIRDERMMVKRFSKIEEAVESRILFVSRSEEENLTEILKHLSQTPVLTVSDIARFAGKGDGSIGHGSKPGPFCSQCGCIRAGRFETELSVVKVSPDRPRRRRR
ncbi:MAG: YfiR family protein [Candidatus Manganitrophus sp. SA1]|nr:YfiR family protein [Candidatus Manganitrophus morganii]